MERAELNQASVRKAAWRKARMSGDGGGGGCVEVATNLPGVIAVRDGKNPGGSALVFTPHEWACFLDGAKGGEFEVPQVRWLPSRGGHNNRSKNAIDKR